MRSDDEYNQQNRDGRRKASSKAPPVTISTRQGIQKPRRIDRGSAARPTTCTRRRSQCAKEVTGETFPTTRMYQIIARIIAMREMLGLLLNEIDASPDTLLK
jgi:hypothetical protein